MTMCHLLGKKIIFEFVVDRSNNEFKMLGYKRNLNIILLLNISINYMKTEGKKVRIASL